MNKKKGNWTTDGLKYEKLLSFPGPRTTFARYFQKDGASFQVILKIKRRLAELDLDKKQPLCVRKDVASM